MINVPTPEEIHELSKSKGWWETPRSVSELDALAHSELSEALEAYRNNEGEQRIYEELADFYIRTKDEIEAIKDDMIFYPKENTTIPEKIQYIHSKIENGNLPERIKALFSVFDKGKILEAVAKKHEYNKTRPYKHGGKAC